MFGNRGLHRGYNPLLRRLWRVVAFLVLLLLILALLGFTPLAGVTHFTAVDVTTWYLADKQTTVTNSLDSITPTGTFQPVVGGTAAAGVSTIAGCTSGRVLVIMGTSDTYTVVFTDTGTLKLGGSRTLGSGDTLTLVCDGTNWYEVAFVNN
jgi:hypothetical protein